jgi:hypothetical protein
MGRARRAADGGVVYHVLNRANARLPILVTLTHTQRWHAYRASTGSGHVYQGRFKSFPIQDDDHFYVVCRYVARNALRAMLVEQAEQWQWVESVALEVWHREGEGASVELARGTAARLDRTSERTADGGGVGGDSALCSARTTLWQ